MEVMEKLLQHRATVDLTTKVIADNVTNRRTIVLLLQSNDTSLILACRNNDLATASVLLRAGAYPNCCNNVTILLHQ